MIQSIETGVTTKNVIKPWWETDAKSEVWKSEVIKDMTPVHITPNETDRLSSIVIDSLDHLERGVTTVGCGSIGEPSIKMLLDRQSILVEESKMKEIKGIEGLVEHLRTLPMKTGKELRRERRKNERNSKKMI